MIVNEGAGGFLNPPTHPEHFKSVRGRDYISSLSSAAKSEWISESLRQEAQRILDEWIPLPLTHPDVKEWISQVLGYFKNCYKGEGENPWNAENLKILKIELTPEALLYEANNHAGVHFIRKFYPEYVPTVEDFQSARWGK